MTNNEELLRLCEAALTERAEHLKYNRHDLSALMLKEYEPVFVALRSLLLQPQATCNVCTGQPLASGKRCICGGIGTQEAELQGLREYIYDLEKKQPQAVPDGYRLAPVSPPRLSVGTLPGILRNIAGSGSANISAGIIREAATTFDETYALLGRLLECFTEEEIEFSDIKEVMSSIDLSSSAAPQPAHSKSEYKRLKALGVEVSPPQPAPDERDYYVALAKHRLTEYSRQLALSGEPHGSIDLAIEYLSLAQQPTPPASIPSESPNGRED